MDRHSFAAILPILLLLFSQACSDSGQESGGRAETGPVEAQQENPAVNNPADNTFTDYLVYVSNEDSNDISVISGPGHTVLSTVPVGKRPRGIKVSPDGSRVYVALSGSPKCPPTMDDEECEELEADKGADGIAEVDAQSREILRILPSGSDPEQFDVDWDTGRLYVSNEDTHTASILDLASGNLVASVPVGREPEGVRLSPDRSRVFVTGETDGDITVLDAADGSEIARVHVGLRPRDSVFTSDGQTAYVSAEHGFHISIIDVAGNSVNGTIDLPEGSLPMGLVLSTDGNTLYVANGRAGTVSVIDLHTNMVTRSIPVGTRPWGLAMSPDGRYLYTANGPSNDVSVIEIGSLEVVATIPVGSSPWGLAVGPVP